MTGATEEPPRGSDAATTADPRPALEALNATIERCRLCPRLRTYGDEVSRTRRKAFVDETYWGRPVPAFGDPFAWLMLVGLAPAAHGAHRTGRMFTGDRSGDFLYAALYRAGWATQPVSRHRGDGLALRGVYITAAARCAPPGNKPLPEEFAHCLPYLTREIELLPEVRVILALGALAHVQVLRALPRAPGAPSPRLAATPFGHGAEYQLGSLWLLDCYHPSQQNTFTGRLTPAMLDAVLRQAAAHRG